MWKTNRTQVYLDTVVCCLLMQSNGNQFHWSSVFVTRYVFFFLVCCSYSCVVRLNAYDWNKYAYGQGKTNADNARNENLEKERKLDDEKIRFFWIRLRELSIDYEIKINIGNLSSFEKTLDAGRAVKTKSIKCHQAAYFPLKLRKYSLLKYTMIPRIPPSTSLQSLPACWKPSNSIRQKSTVQDLCQQFIYLTST